MLSREDRSKLKTVRAEIIQRLQQFADVSRSKWRREVALCLLTPQSSPVKAEACLCALERKGIFEGKLNVRTIAETLRSPTAYVRFHNNKARYLSEYVSSWGEILAILDAGLLPHIERDLLVKTVCGLGPKEASHALRNIGRRNLAILDRHILRELVNYGVLHEMPKTISAKSYREIEARFLVFADSCGEEMDVLDLFFWSKATGFVFK